MDFDLWWLFFIPLVFGLGWMAARFDLKSLLSESARLPRSYFRGLNFLLNEQPDKAIDAFIEVVKLDPETTELHFALGNLFRRRGETERAIRVHQNLLSRADLPANERAHALYELGQDFLKAGLLDRAEANFQALSALQESAYAKEAQTSLLTLYEIQKDWGQALVIAKQLEAMGVRSYKKEIAQFHCELAEEALQRKDIGQAQQELEHALSVNATNARAMILYGDVEMLNAQPAAAIAQWQQIEKQNAAYLPLVADRLMTAYAALNQASNGACLLLEYLERHPSSELLTIVYQYVAKHEGLEVAYELARRQMQKSPSLTGMLRLLEAQMVNAEEPRLSELKAMHATVRQRTKNLHRYVCQNCGFRARLFYWQCPGCNGWETYASRRFEPVTSA